MSFSISPKGTLHDRWRTRIFLMQRGCSLVFSSVPDLAFLFPLMLVHLSVQWLPIWQSWSKTYPEPKKCSICWVSHMFSIWEYRYSYGICFGTVYALQNSTPNISTPNILSFFSVHTRRVEIGHILCRRSWLYIHTYITLHYITLRYITLRYITLHTLRIYWNKWGYG